MLAFPNCKINIGLYITNKRDDGYHDLETVFYPLSVNDVLEIVPTENSTQLHLKGKSIAGNHEKNLVWKAHQLLRQQYPDTVGALDIYLLKNIPMGAGLGGGSSDGAYMLRLLNDYYQLSIPEEDMIAYALQLGSDCPFFIINKPVFASGRGELMKSINLDLSAYSIQLVCPGIHVSTAEAFSNIKPQKAGTDLRTLSSLPVEEWRINVENNFEKTVFPQHPTIAAIKDSLYQAGAIYASMSGTGSSVYGIFHKGEKATVNESWENFYIL